MLKYWLFLANLAILFPLFCPAQNTTEPGYILTLSQDTVWGKLRQESQGGLSASVVLMQEGKADNPYTITEIAGFGYPDGRLFLSGVLDDQFVEAIQLGTLDLFRSASGFVVRKEDKVYELKAGSSFVTTENGTAQVKSKKWLGILSLLINDCSEDLQKYLQGSRLSERALLRVVNKYNQCKNPQEVSTQKNGLKWIKTTLGVTAGFQSTRLKVSDPALFFTHLANKYKSTGLMVGLEIANTFPRVNKHVHFLVTPSYLKNVYQSNKESSIRFDKVRMEYNTLTLPMSLGYSLELGTTKLLFLAGPTLDIHLKVKEEWLTYRKRDNALFQSEMKDPMDQYNFQYGFNYGVRLAKEFAKFVLATDLRITNLSALSLDYPPGETVFRVPAELKVSANRFSFNIAIRKK